MSGRNAYEIKLATLRKARNPKIQSTVTIIDTKKGVVEHAFLNENATKVRGRRQREEISEHARAKLFD
jgi:hypothetical protein